MLIKKGSIFELYPHKVKYTQHGKEYEQWALPNKQWWIDFAEKWEHTKIIEFTEVGLSEEQLKRFEEINQFNLSESFISICEDYIFNGEFPKTPKHPLKELQIIKEQQQQDEYLIDLDFRQSMSEMGV